MGEYGDAYRGSRARLTTLANGLDAASLEKTVPTCPEWRVKDVYGHLIGLVADVSAGNLEGAGSDEWTQKQVDHRLDRTGAELVAEWDGSGPGMETMLDGVRSADQVRAFAWTGDAEPYVAIFSAYGNPTSPVVE